MTKILKVYGDDDYGALMFEQDCELSYAEAWEDSNNKDGVYVEWQDGCYYEAYSFGDVDPYFLAFVDGEKDYDATKHIDWVVITEDKV
jgi:hypothetical protein